MSQPTHLYLSSDASSVNDEERKKKVIDPPASSSELQRQGHYDPYISLYETPDYSAPEVTYESCQVPEVTYQNADQWWSLGLGSVSTLVCLVSALSRVSNPQDHLHCNWRRWQLVRYKTVSIILETRRPNSIFLTLCRRNWVVYFVKACRVYVK